MVWLPLVAEKRALHLEIVSARTDVEPLPSFITIRRSLPPCPIQSATIERKMIFRCGWEPAGKLHSKSRCWQNRNSRTRYVSGREISTTAVDRGKPRLQAKPVSRSERKRNVIPRGEMFVVYQRLQVDVVRMVSAVN